MNLDDAFGIISGPQAAPPDVESAPTATPRAKATAAPEPTQGMPKRGQSLDDMLAAASSPELLAKWKQGVDALPAPLRFVVPSGPEDALLAASTGLMGPEVAYGGRGALQLARGWLSRIAAPTAAGALGAKMEGKPVLGGAVKGAALGGLGEGIYQGQRYVGTSRLGNYLANEIPQRISAVAQRYAPWLPTFNSPVEFLRSIMHPNRPGTGAQSVLSDRFENEMTDIDTQLAQQGAQGLTTRFTANPNVPGSGTMPGIGGPAPTTFREGLDAVDLLGRMATNEEELLKRNVTATQALRTRDALVDDMENHLGHFGLDDQYRGAREQYGRGKSLYRLLSQPGVIQNGRLNREALQSSYQNLGPQGLDIDAKWAPHELDDLEHAFFGEGSPAMNDVAGKPPRVRTALTTRHIPPIYADPPVMPVFVGERPLAPWTPPQITHFVTQRGAATASGGTRQPDLSAIGGDQAPPSNVVMPDQMGPTADSPDAQLVTAIQADPRFEGVSPEEIGRLVAAARARRAAR